MPFCSTTPCHDYHATTPQRPAPSSCAVAASSDVQRSPKSLLLFPQLPALRLSGLPHASDGSLSGSPLAPTRSSDLLLRFCGEDPTQQGDTIAKQFWGDTIAKLLHYSLMALTRQSPL